MLKSPAAVRCRPSLLRLQLPQAPSIDDVPHRTGDCPATPDAAERCKQTKPTTKRRPSDTSRRANVAWGRQHLWRKSYDGELTTGRRNCKEQVGHANEPKGVSRDDASKEGTTPAGAAVARPGVGPGFHPETFDAWGAAANPLGRVWRGFARSREPHCHLNAGAATSVFKISTVHVSTTGPAT
jgi:hypothetical protein